MSKSQSITSKWQAQFLTWFKVVSWWISIIINSSERVNESGFHSLSCHHLQTLIYSRGEGWRFTRCPSCSDPFTRFVPFSQCRRLRPHLCRSHIFGNGSTGATASGGERAPYLTPKNLGCSPGAAVSVSIFRLSMWAMEMTVAATYQGSPMKEQMTIRTATKNRSRWYPAPFCVRGSASQNMRNTSTLRVYFICLSFINNIWKTKYDIQLFPRTVIHNFIHTFFFTHYIPQWRSL